MKRIKSKLLQDIIKVLSGNIVAQGIGFLIIIFISRDLGPQDYGVFSLLIAIFTFTVLFVDFGISTSYIKYVSENLSISKDILLSTLISKVLFLLLFLPILFLYANKFSLFFFSTEQYTKNIQFILIAIFFHDILSLFQSHNQALQNFKIFNIIKISHNLLKLITLILISFIFKQDFHLDLFIFVYIFIVIIIISILIIRNLNYFIYGYNVKFIYIKDIYKLGFWIFLSTLATSILTRIDLIMLQKLANGEEVAYYSVANNLAMMIPLITSSIMITLLPKLTGYLKTRSIKEYVSRILNKSKYIIILLIFIELFSPLLINILFGNEYNNSILPFQILLIALTFGVIINPISLVLLTINKAYILVIINWILIPLNYFSNIYFIPNWGASGAAFTTSILNLIGGGLTIFFVLKYSNYFIKGGEVE